jgi:hypothetical protein
MLCPVQDTETSTILLDYCARRLDGSTATDLKRHMALCSECREFAAGVETVWSALDAWAAEPIAGDFDSRLLARISEDDRRKFWPRILGVRFSWKLSIGAACATAAVIFVISSRSSRQSSAAQPHNAPVSQTESLEPEQIERSVEDLEMLRQFSTGQTI